MEAFQQKDKNRYEKHPEVTDVYLINIIDRYFNTMKADEDAAMEKIITAAMARYKGSIGYKDKGVRSFNGKEGIVHYSLMSLGIMEKIIKKSAFNKDFGTETDTVCAGDDQRLYDKREPREHQHLLSSVLNLETVLHSLNVSAARYGKHSHGNENVLSRIKTEQPFDLKNAENACDTVFQKLELLRQKTAELENIEKQYRFLLDKIIAVTGG